MQTRPWIQSSLVVAALGTLLLAASAHADVVPPEEDACRGKKVDDRCKVMGKPDLGEPDSSCKMAKCSRLDYPNWNRDMMAAPPTIKVDCLLCSADAARDMAGAPSPDLATKPASGGGSCSMAPRPLVRAAPWLLAGSFSLLLLGRRRRRP